MNNDTMTTIGICGGGTMGAGIALNCLQAGYTVFLYDSFAQAQERCIAFLQQNLDKAVKKKLITQESADAAFSRFTFTQTLTDLKPCELVIEAIIEEQAPKQTLFSALEDIVPQSTLIASNTSSISITALAASLRHPERFIGMHFFNPPHVMKLVEVIAGKRTSPEAVLTVVELCKKLGRTPAIAKDVPGFIVNRVARNYYLEAMRITSEGGASVEQVDVLMRSAGFKMGPFELVDLIGVDTNYAVTLSVWEQYFREPRFAPALVQKEYVDAGLHGRKTGEGFYKYDKPIDK